MALLLNLSGWPADEPAFGGPCRASGSMDFTGALAGEAILLCLPRHDRHVLSGRFLEFHL
jgi:hypothetical protein